MIDLERNIIAAVHEIFTTMVMMEPVAGTAVVDANHPLPVNISGTVGLAGDLRGILALHCPAGVAAAMTGNLLGMEVEGITEDVEDAIGELTNMLAGSLKTSLQAESGSNLTLSVPNTVIGKSYRVTSFSGAANLVVPFTLEQGQFWVELKYIWKFS